MVAGLGLLVAGVLIPAQRELHELENTRAIHAAIEERSVRQLAAYDRFLNDLDRGDDQLVRRLAASQLNQMPEGERSLLLVPSMNDTVTAWIERSEPLQLPETADYPDTLLTRLSTGPRRLWVLACGAFLVFIGLLLGPTSFTARRGSRGSGSGIAGAGSAVAEAPVRDSAVMSAPVAVAIDRAELPAAAPSACVDDSSDEHLAQTACVATAAVVAEASDSVAALLAVENGAAAASAPVVGEMACNSDSAGSAAEALSETTVEAPEAAVAEAIPADAASFEHREEACDSVVVAVTEVAEAAAAIVAEQAPPSDAACMAVYAEPVDTECVSAETSVEAESAGAQALESGELESDGFDAEATDAVEVDAVEVDAVEVDIGETEGAEDEEAEDDGSEDDETEDDEAEDDCCDDSEFSVESCGSHAESAGEYLFEPSDDYLRTDGGEDIASANTDLVRRNRKKPSSQASSVEDAYASMTLFDGIEEDRWLDTRDPRDSTAADPHGAR